MRSTFVIGHWVFTLLLAPLTSQVIGYFYGTDPHQIVGLLEVYPIALMFSIAFSIPTLLIYLIFFYFLSKNRVSISISKFVLIAVSAIGIVITQTIIKGSMSRDIIIAYSVTSVIVGLVLRLKDVNSNTQV
jgi:hypothetical protein